ncbi:ATP-binding protein [Streptomyces ferrugineus]|uniref:ATP-binding protein n=1 Tax=Streptomyces ferrugineus TaxID=1413221 RepID=A0A7M2SIR8_9ACTN|nr:ATP-binding protein [Streptomyces ferrugineus]QOV35929.1 ATP-binding protein [Streptomyces ferrugineus]
MPEPHSSTDPVHHEDQLDYTPVPRSVSLARHRTTRLVTAWGYPHLAYDAALVVSELMTKALLHGSLRDRLIRLRISTTAAALRVDVSDPRAERLPCPRDATGEDQFGRGLTLVGALAEDWGAGPRIGVGKTVWAEWGLALTLCGSDPVARAKE